jgi:hypothetical protein
LHFRLSVLPRNRHRQHSGNGQEEMNLILSELAPVSGVRAQDAKSPAVAGYGNGDTAYDSVFHQERSGAKPVLRPKPINYDRLARLQRKTQLSVGLDRDRSQANAAISPASAGPQQHRSAVGHCFQNAAVFNLQRLGYQHDGLVK